MKMINKKLEIGFVCIMIFLLISPFIAAEGSTIYSELLRTGVDPKAKHFSSDFNENIDLFSGNLNIRQVDFTVPGRNGMSIDVVRYYNSKLWTGWVSETSNSKTIKKELHNSPIGLGWNFLVGKITSQTDTLYPYRNEPYVIFSDGTSRSILETIDGEYITTSHDKVELVRDTQGNPIEIPNTDKLMQRVTTKSGMKYTFGHVVPATGGYTYATRIEDPNGNSMTIEYYDKSQIPRIITGVNGNRAEFFMNNQGLISQAVFMKGDQEDNIIVEYEYTQLNEDDRWSWVLKSVNYYSFDGEIDDIKFDYPIGCTLDPDQACAYYDSGNPPWDTRKDDQPSEVSGLVPIKPPITFTYLSEVYGLNTATFNYELYEVELSSGKTISYVYDIVDFTTSSECANVLGGESNQFYQRVVSERQEDGIGGPQTNYFYNQEESYPILSSTGFDSLGVQTTLVQKDDGLYEVVFFPVCSAAPQMAALTGRIIKEELIDDNGNGHYEKIYTYTIRDMGTHYISGTTSRNFVMNALVQKEAEKKSGGLWQIKSYRKYGDGPDYDSYSAQDDPGTALELQNGLGMSNFNATDHPTNYDIWWDYDEFDNPRFIADYGKVTGLDYDSDIVETLSGTSGPYYIGYLTHSDTDITDNKIQIKQYVSDMDAYAQNSLLDNHILDREVVSLLTDNGDIDVDVVINDERLNLIETNPYFDDTDGNGVPDGWNDYWGEMDYNYGYPTKPSIKLSSGYFYYPSINVIQGELYRFEVYVKGSNPDGDYVCEELTLEYDGGTLSGPIAVTNSFGNYRVIRGNFIAPSNDLTNVGLECSGTVASNAIADFLVIEPLYANRYFGMDEAVVRKYDHSTGDLLSERRVGLNGDKGIKTSYEYDRFGNMIAETSPEGHRTRYVYSSVYDYAFQTKMIRPNGNLGYERTYSAAGHMTSQTDGEGNTIRLKYDPLGRITRIAQPDNWGGTWAETAPTLWTIYDDFNRELTIKRRQK